MLNFSNFFTHSSNLRDRWSGLHRQDYKVGCLQSVLPEFPLPAMILITATISLMSTFLSEFTSAFL